MSKSKPRSSQVQAQCVRFPSWEGGEECLPLKREEILRDARAAEEVLRDARAAKQGEDVAGNKLCDTASKERGESTSAQKCNIQGFASSEMCPSIILERAAHRGVANCAPIPAHRVRKTHKLLQPACALHTTAFTHSTMHSEKAPRSNTRTLRYNTRSTASVAHAERTNATRTLSAALTTRLRNNNRHMGRRTRDVQNWLVDSHPARAR